MAAPTNSGESDMATEDFCLNLSPLLSPRWSPLCLTPSPPRGFLPSSRVMQYQGCNQSTYNPPQNQEHEDMVDPPPYLARDSALLQQQQQQKLRQNWSVASDWRPRGGGIMRMNNQGFEESNMGFEEESEEMVMMTCFYFPPSPTDFPLYPPVPSVFFVSTNIQEDISLAFPYQHILEDKSGALHVINWEEAVNTFDLLSCGLGSYPFEKFGDLCQMARAPGVAPMELLVDNIFEPAYYDERKVTLRRINWLEQHDEDIVDQLVIELVGEVQQLIQNRGGELDVILGGGVLMINGLEHIDCQGLPMTPETLRICQAKISFRVWLRHGGQWAAETRYRFNRLNIGKFTTVEDAISAYEVVARLSGWTDLTGFPGLSENANISKLSLQLPSAAQEDKPDEDFGTEAVGTGSERTGECVMVDQARLNSGCLGKRKTKEKYPGGERRNKKTNGVKITIPLEDISQTKGMRLKDAANHLGAQQENLDEDFGNEVEAVAMGSKGIGEGEMEEGQMNSRYLGKMKMKEKTSGEERGNKKTTGVRIAIPLEDILQTKKMPLKDAAKHLKVSISTLKRACREYDIPRWPPRGEHKLISQSCPNESPAVVDKEQIPQLNSHMLLPSNQFSATIGTESVTVKARFGTVTIRFQLSWPWRMVELKQQVEKRLESEAGTYHICYKDQDNDDDFLIACDDDLLYHISHSRLPGTNSIEVFLKPK